MPQLILIWTILTMFLLLVPLQEESSREALNKAGRMRKFLLVVPKWADDSPAIGRPSGKIHTGSPSGMLL